jgi:acyl-CoA hydrolase
MNPRPARESEAIVGELMMPGQANNRGNVHGGVLLGMIDRAGGIAAQRYSRRPVVTASIDRVDFTEPVLLGEYVILHAKVTAVFRTSCEVRVLVEAENLSTGDRRIANTCFLTFVALGEDGRPVPIPPLLAESEAERSAERAAHHRRAARLRLVDELQREGL